MASTSATNAHDEMTLKEPCVAAVLFMCDERDLVLTAVNTLRKRKIAVEVTSLWQEVEVLKTQNGTLSPGEEGGKTARSHNDDNYGSDGESQTRSLDSIPQPPSPLPSSSTPDTQTDAETDADSLDRREAQSGALRLQPARKEKNRMTGKDPTFLRKKLQSLREENRRLKERQVCRQCRQQPVSITFLPCGHYSFCYDCGTKINTCPLCYKTILADVRTFLA